MSESPDRALISGLLAGQRQALARSITLVESTRADHRKRADELIAAVLPHTSGAVRVGISGPPGVGKSTFIEALGLQLCERGHKVAVLAVDPSSIVRGGSILGDKTRMSELSRHPGAFVRPSPSSGALGGVHDDSRDAILLCEAAGYDVVLVETVGVGQSEVSVANLVDTVLVLLLPGAGDELQGIKKGLLEVADVLAINKADGDNELRARRTRKDYRAALHLVRQQTPTWTPPVLLCSALDKVGIDEVWQQILAHQAALKPTGEWQQKRRKQAVAAMWQALERGLVTRLRSTAETSGLADRLEAEVADTKVAPAAAATALLDALLATGAAARDRLLADGSQGLGEDTAV